MSSNHHVIMEFNYDELSRNRNARLTRSRLENTVTSDSIIDFNYEDLNPNGFIGPMNKNLDSNFIENQISNTSCSKSFVRIMVLYTPSAANYGNVNNIIAQAVAETNDAYWNSNVTSGGVILQHSQMIDFDESSNMENDLKVRLIGNDSVRELRDEYEADVVILLTGNNVYGNIEGWAANLRAKKDSAYAIVDIGDAVSPDFTFAHELGHLHSLQHYPGDGVNPSATLYPYSYGHKFSYLCGLGIFRCYKTTLMGYATSFPEPNYNYIKNYSNPNVSYQGKATGTSNRNNSLVLNNIIPTVADFRGGTDLVAGLNTIEGSSNQFGQNFTFINQTCGGDGSVSIEWSKSLNNPTNFGGVESNSSTYSPLLSPGTWYIKLKATSTTGQISTKVVSVVSEDSQSCSGTCPGGGPIPKIIPDIKNESDTTPNSIILNTAYPNPFNPSTNISIDLKENRNIELNVYDINGRLVKVLASGIYSAGNHRFLFNASDLSSGTYIIHLQSDEFIETQTVMLIK